MWSAAIPKPAENMPSDDTTPHNAPLRIIRCTGEDAEVGAALAVALRGDELHGLDVEAQGLDRAGEAGLGHGKGADGCHCRVPFFQSGRANRDLDGGRSTGDDRTAPEGHSASA